MTPGQYLQKRRVAAGLSLAEVVDRLAGQPVLFIRPTQRDVDRMLGRLRRIEANGDFLTPEQAEMMARIFPCAPQVYLQLAALHHSGPGLDLPQPALCAKCACSWTDPCTGPDGACAWTGPEQNLCSACDAIERKAA